MDSLYLKSNWKILINLKEKKKQALILYLQDNNDSTALYYRKRISYGVEVFILSFLFFFFSPCYSCSSSNDHSRISFVLSSSRFFSSVLFIPHIYCQAFRCIQIQLSIISTLHMAFEYWMTRCNMWPWLLDSILAQFRY